MLTDQIISLSRYLNSDLQMIIDKVIHRKAYYGHLKNLFIAVFGVDREIIQNRAYQRTEKSIRIP